MYDACNRTVPRTSDTAGENTLVRYRLILSADFRLHNLQVQ